MTIYLQSNINVDAGADVGTYYDKNDTSWLIHPNAVIDIDNEHGRFYWNGTMYASLAALIAAHGSSAGGVNRIYLPSALAAAHAIFGKATIPAIASAGRNMVVLDDGADGLPADELEFMGANSSNFAVAGVFGNSVSNFGYSGTTAMTVGSTVKMAMRLGSSGANFSYNGGSLAGAGSGITSAATQMVIGNREDGARPWVRISSVSH